jgi:hypothetical protein
VSASVARADFPARLDHAGALGFAAELGGEYDSSVPLSGIAQKTVLASQADTARGLGTISGSWGLSGGDELVLTLGATIGPEFRTPVSQGQTVGPLHREWGATISPTYRDFRSRNEWKSFIEAGVKADTAPMFAIGPMVAAGLEYEESPVLGVYLRGTGSLELGQILRAGFGLTLGIQGRTYLF